MKIEEAKEFLIDISYKLGNMSVEYLTEKDGEKMREAIEALEQGLVMDKIRAEIEQAADKQFQIAMGVSDLNERYAHIRMENAYRHSLNIIDKYKAESEET